MLFLPDENLIVWQIVALIHVMGVSLTAVYFYRHQRTIKNKALRRTFILLWGFVILVVPLGWAMYLISSGQRFLN